MTRETTAQLLLEATTQLIHQPNPDTTTRQLVRRLWDAHADLLSLTKRHEPEEDALTEHFETTSDLLDLLAWARPYIGRDVPSVSKDPNNPQLQQIDAALRYQATSKSLTETR